ncbi:DUF1007 family protein [Alisedimentitalea sp. MJ-SS2]|uniref:DUF1007 family protein n=1 Tax=Aliisedimentitalea sp. MJ-SS2 TaxID=3049795 RepID=UPI00290CC5E2|nr:DUF1007 family protein [Alisedimentitalea sp. MJ-SS2]MDU8926328.1 DUF1007 family protein [Alisedimentitalea sp. MJ-SS2]
MKRFLQTCATLACVALPSVATAHPHIFIETGLKPVLDDTGRLIGIEVSWRYDELYSLLVLEDKGLDHDYDGKLTEDEMSRLKGFDQNWVDGYAGDLFIHQGEAELTLGPPEGRGTSFEDGKITSIHYRRIEGAAPGHPWLLQAYDPTYYTAYDLGLGVDAPEGCEVKVTQADLDRAYTLVEEALYATPADPEGNFPEVGEAFADKVELSCVSG